MSAYILLDLRDKDHKTYKLKDFEIEIILFIS